jgi:uncharacterized damage-inducible protein DinB
MSDASLLDALLDSWDRNNRILVNLLRALPEESLDLKPTDDSMSVAELFDHMNFGRLISTSEAVPEFCPNPPGEDRVKERDRGRLVEMLNGSARLVADAVRARIEAGRPTDLRYDHPVLFLQHMIWHEGYHHGQIKLTLKQAGRAFDDEAIGPATWDVWMMKTR